MKSINEAVIGRTVLVRRKMKGKYFEKPWIGEIHSRVPWSTFRRLDYCRCRITWRWEL